MADFLNQNQSSTETVVDKLEIVNSYGVSRDVLNIFHSLEIHEDIYAYGIQGTITLNDATDLIGTLELHGNEYINIQFGRPGASDSEKYRGTFRIYKVGDRVPNDNMQTYDIHFCSSEIIFANQQMISKSFKDANYTTYVIEILRSLRVNSKKINLYNFETAYGTDNIALTKKKPFEVVDLFTKYSFNSAGSCFMFFENKNGFNFVSLQTLFKREPLVQLKYSQAKLVEDTTSSPFTTPSEITKFRFTSNFDILKNTNTATYSGRLYTLDLIRQNYKRRDYSYLNEYKMNMDSPFPFNDAKNRNQKSLYEEYNTNVDYQLTNLDQKNTSYFVSKIQRPLNTNIERSLVQRKMQLSMLENTAMECIIPGNAILYVGAMVKFDMPSFTRSDPNSRTIDPFASGKYMISAVRHQISNSGKSGLKYTSLLRLVKNSASSSYTPSTNNGKYDTVKKL